MNINDRYNDRKQISGHESDSEKTKQKNRDEKVVKRGKCEDLKLMTENSKCL